jgi:hypothetical protein
MRKIYLAVLLMSSGFVNAGVKTETFDKLRLTSVVFRQESPGNFHIDTRYIVINTTTTNSITHTRNLDGLIGVNISTTTLTNMFTVFTSTISALEQFTP